MEPRVATEWARRIERAQTLQETQPAASELLRFYEQVLRIQASIYRESSNVVNGDLPFREQVELDTSIRHLPELIEIMDRRGEGLLYPMEEKLSLRAAEHARGLMQAELLRDVVPSLEPTAERFHAMALLQPAMEYVASVFPSRDEPGNRCPKCGALPTLAILRPEGEGAKRWLQCSMCLTEWQFRRVLCPWCGETDKDRLPRFTAEECNYVRIEACDTCKRYLKSIDLTVEGHAVAMVDEIALAALDVWAVEKGFAKLCPNLLGL